MGFMFSIMYQQYYVVLNPPNKGIAAYYYLMGFWMIIEITMFYTLILTSVMFLFFVQIRGIMGYKSEILNQYRFKYDALDYYENDIEWLSFQVVPFVVHIMVFYWSWFD